MASFDDIASDTDLGAETLLVLLHGSADGAARARARGQERVKTGWMPVTQGRSTGRRSGRLATSRITSAIAS